MSKQAEKSEENIEKSIKLKEIGQLNDEDVKKATDKTV